MEKSKEREAKKTIRLEALERRESLTAAQRTDYSGRIVERLTKMTCYMEAEAVLTYVSFRSEVDTFLLMKRAFSDGKAVFAPRVAGRDMEFYRIDSVNDLAAGYRGILEPKGGISYVDWIGHARIKQGVDGFTGVKEGNRETDLPPTLICLPGAAFDRACHRIGYGGGFYDRYLERLLQVKFAAAALAFHCQIFEEIPWEAHDVSPMYIVTEKELLIRQNKA